MNQVYDKAALELPRRESTFRAIGRIETPAHRSFELPPASVRVLRRNLALHLVRSNSGKADHGPQLF